MSLSGQCLCGKVRYEGQGTPSAVHVCHCTDCARWNGGPYLGVTFSEGVAVGDGPVHWFESSEWAMRGSCAHCGSGLFWKMRDGQEFTVTAGSLDDPSAIGAVAEHIFIDQKPHYYDFKDDAPQLTAAQVIEKYLGGSSDNGGQG